MQLSTNTANLFMPVGRVFRHGSALVLMNKRDDRAAEQDVQQDHELWPVARKWEIILPKRQSKCTNEKSGREQFNVRT